MQQYRTLLEIVPVLTSFILFLRYVYSVIRTWHKTTCVMMTSMRKCRACQPCFRSHLPCPS